MYQTDPESLVMADPFKGGTRSLSESEMEAEDPAFKAKYPGVASMMRAKNPYHPDSGNVGLGLGQSLRRGFDSFTGSKWFDQSNKGPWHSALTYGAPAAILGALGGLGLGAWRKFSDPYNESTLTGSAAKGALLGALGGGSVGLYANNFRKSAAFTGSGLSSVIEAIRDSGMGISEQQTLISQLSGMSQQQIRDLMVLLATAGGAAAGSVAVRYIAGKSLINGALGAAMGGFISNRLVNSFTRPTQREPGTGFYGHNAHSW